MYSAKFMIKDIVSGYNCVQTNVIATKIEYRYVIILSHDCTKYYHIIILKCKCLIIIK